MTKPDGIQTKVTVEKAYKGATGEVQPQTSVIDGNIGQGPRALSGADLMALLKDMKTPTGPNIATKKPTAPKRGMNF